MMDDAEGVAGGLFTDVSLCKNPGSTLILQIHGTADKTIPYAAIQSIPVPLKRFKTGRLLRDAH